MATYKELLAERDTLEQKIEEARISEAADAIKQVKDLIATFGLTAADCGFVKAKTASKGVAKAPGIKVPAGTYADPKNPAKTWNAHGRKPQWFLDALADGKTVEQMRVK